ncbi:MAG TPA: Calx-beta domain-containing protein, partial [Isosphaeraceae bacterium]
MVVASGAGTINFTGTNDNRQATIINSGVLRVIATDAIPSTSTVTVDAGATLNLNNFNDTIGSLSGGGSVTLGSGTLTTGSNNLSTLFSGVISGTGGVTKLCPCTLTLTGANTYTGPTIINEGVIRVDGSLAPASVVTVNSTGTSPGTLEGIGIVGGTVLANAGGAVAPGSGTNPGPNTSPGILSTGSVTFTPGSSFAVDLNGPYTSPGKDYDQLNVTGTVNLGGATLTLNGGGVAPPTGAALKLILIQNDGTDPVVGTFGGLPEGASVTVGAFKGTISYVGGDGNDVVVNVVPTVTLSLSGSPLAENGVATVTATLSDVAPEDVTVDLGFTGTATPGSDYAPSATSIVIPAGSLSASITLTAIDDNVDEPDETFVVDIVGVTNGVESGTQQVAGLLIDNDLPTVSLGLVGSPLDEAGGVATVTATLLNPSTQDVTVALGFGGSAAPGVDYSQSATTIVIPAGSLSGSITVTTIDDALNEPAETAVVSIVGVTNGTAGATPQVTALIVDNDPLPQLSIDDVTVMEGDTGTVTATFTIHLSAPSGQTVTVGVSTADGSAVAPADYLNPFLTGVVFTPGTTTQTVSVQVNGDTLDEDDETFVINLSSPTNATIVDGQGVATILDDDPLPTVSIDRVFLSVFVTEGAAGQSVVGFIVRLLAPSGRTVSVDVATVDGTATAPGDYGAFATNLVFLPGQTATFFGVPINDDTLNESPEGFSVRLSGAVAAVIGNGQATVTIFDNDPMPRVSIDDVTVVEGDTGQVTATFTIRLSEPSGQGVNVVAATADGTATSPADFVSSPFLPAFFLPGQVSQTISVLVNGDALNEGDETFFVNLNGAANATIADPQAVGTIADDDPLPALAIDDVVILEGASGPALARFTVRLSAPSGRTVTVAVATADGTATAPADYTVTQTVLIFPPGSTVQTVDVVINGDMLDEVGETFFVTLDSGAINATIARGRGTGTIVDDDTAGVVGFLTPTFAVAEDAGSAVITVVRSGGSDGTLTVPFTTAAGTATAGTDFVLSSGVLVFGPGQTSRTFAAPIRDDLLIEGDETVRLVLNAPLELGSPGGAGSTAVLTIVDDDSLVVTTTADAGRGSLRRAILTSNDPGNPSLGTITFAIPGAGVQAIRPLSALPTIARPVLVDATTQPGFAGTPIVELDGSRAGAGVDGLDIAAGSSTVRGLAINRFAGSGIVLRTGGGNAIQGNFVGTDAAGASDLGNDGDGVRIVDAPGNTIGGTAPGARNVLSGNGDARNEAAGISIVGTGAIGNRILGNLIGTSAEGTRALGNSSHGVFVSAPGNVIGGAEPGAGNVIAGNGLRRRGGEDGVGVYIFAGGSNTVQGNRIGTDATGTRGLGNSKIGVLVSFAPANTIGGPSPAARNVISGNGLIGLELANTGATGNVVQGNFIGLDATGLPLGNGSPDDQGDRDGMGIFLNDAPGNLIGGAGAGNVVSGNLS